MRKLLPLLVLFATATVALAQGRITFENDSLHLVYMTTDTGRLLSADVALAGQPVPAFGQLPSGHSLMIDLWGGTASTSLAKLTTTTFNATPGRFGPVSIVIPLPASVPDFFQVTVYDQAAGSYAVANAGTELYYGASAIFTVIPNPGPTTYNSIVGSTSTWAPGPNPIPGGLGSIVVQMNPIPEPSVLALFGLGAALWASRRGKS